MTIFLRFLVVLILFLITNCAHLPPQPERIITSPEELISKVEKGTTEVKSLKASISLRYTSEEGTQRGSGVLFIKKPSSLRVDLISPMGVPVFFLIINGDHFFGGFPRENRYYQGETTRENLNELINFDITSEELLSIFLGAPDFEHAIPEQLIYEPDTASYQLMLKKPVSERDDIIQIIGIDSINFKLRKIQIKPADYPSYTVEYKNFDGPVPLEFVISDDSFRESSDSREIRVKYSDVENNPALDPIIFEFPQNLSDEVINLE